MTRTTKLELQQINTRLANENAALRAQVSQLQADIERITEVASALNAPRIPFGGQETPRLRAMREARELAMSTGRCIKV
jgi:hypothetical protein